MSPWKERLRAATPLIFLLAISLQPALTIASTASQSRAKHIRSNAALHDSYDFVIVGGGASGLTVADRLTEDPSTTVLVLEFGPFDTQEPSVLVPGLLNLTSTPYWFNVTSTPQPHLQNRTFPVTIAAAVGGGTVINGMFFHRGAKADYGAWEELGAIGWGWSDLLPYFKKGETFTPPESGFGREWGIKWDDQVHGTHGPIQLSYPPYQFPIVKDFFNAFRELGVTTPNDPSDGSAKGVFWVPSTLDPVERTRSYARTAHYDRISAARPNYHVLPMTVVTRIIFDESNNAIGVEYATRARNETFKIKADKEVILAAGAVHTPQILQLSGIGDKYDLNKHGIECIADVPGVGHNFQDHPTLYFINECKQQRGGYEAYSDFQTVQQNPEPNAEDLITNQTYKSEQLALYQGSREGAYTIVSNGGNTAAFVSLPQIVPPTIVAQLLNHTSLPSDSTLPLSIQDLYAHQRSIHLRQFTTNDTAVQETAFNGGFLPLTLLHPLSRGRISLASSAPLSAPLVDYGTLSHPVDSSMFVHMLHFNRRLLQMPSLAALRPIEFVPGANVSTDQELMSMLPDMVQPTFQHPCCTAAIGQKDRGGVVDPENLLVWGVQRLSVVDASLMPLIVGAHLMGTVYAIAEKAADMIKERHKVVY